MLNSKTEIYLASKSPRRKKLLEQLNLKFKVIDVDSNERIKKYEKPFETVKRLSWEKMEKAKKLIKKGIVITADTIVVINNSILGKPRNEKDAERILKILSGKTHYVYTGFSIFNFENQQSITDYEKTAVTFRDLDEEEIRAYIRGGSPMDKAGAYGIQDDFGAVFVKKINGCYYNVVGLPLPKVYDSLKRIAE
ncbi:MAG TPA: Maf family protein [Ignavibacteriaceae bacterium]|jgi:septum formation protein|nr:Maf family protein [Ignavibacteriaceae bacterium]